MIANDRVGRGPGTNARATAIWTPQERIALIERASTIEERLGPAYELAALPESDPILQRRLERWREIVTKGDHASFDKCLDWQGLDITTASRALLQPRWSGDEGSPRWLETIERIVRAAASAAAVDSAALCAPDRPVRFAAFYGPFVLVGRELLAQELARVDALEQIRIHDVVWTELERALVRSLAFLSARVLALEFEVFSVQSGLSPLATSSSGERDLEAAFVRTLSTTGLKSLLTEYCVLARQTATMVMRWAEVAGEFFARLAGDLSDLQAAFANADGLGELAGLDVGLSDPHHDGRSVFRLTFTSGVRVIYKPRPVSPDLAYYHLLGWLNARNAPVPFRILRYVDGGTYGWVEHVDHEPCDTWPQLEQFARGAGAVLCIAHFLQSTDLHDGNLIANVGGPVVIDLETIMAPQLTPQAGANVDNARGRAEQHTSESVVRTAMLPTWRFGPNHEAADIGGLGDLCGVKTAAWYQRSEEADPVGPALRPEFTAALGNLPGAGPSTRTLIEDVVNGFEGTYRFLVARREELLTAGSPLEGLRRIPVRFLLRDTSVYLGILRRSFAPERLRDAADWSIELESVKRALHLWQTRPSFVPLLAAEARSMSALNVPYFSTVANVTSLQLDHGGQVADFFVQSSDDQLRVGAQAMSDERLRAQVELIRSSFAIRLAGRPHEDTIPPAAATRETAGGPVSLRDEALAIGDRISARAIRGSDGSAAWIAAVPDNDSGCFQLGNALTDFLAGSSGVAVFLAALARTTGQARFRELADGALRSLTGADGSAATASLLANPTMRAQIGRATMLGLTLYGLVKAGELLEETEWIHLALDLASGIDESTIGANSNASLCHGTAGTVVGLLALARHDPTGAMLGRAILCGRQLLERTGVRAAPNSDAPKDAAPSDGFGRSRAAGPVGVASGAAGVGYALARLAEQTGERAFLDGALHAMRFVHGAGAAGADRRDPSWCTGSAGIALVHLRCAGLGEIAGQDAIDRGVRATLETPVGGLDVLCCGTFGRIELLLEASRRLDRPDLHRAAIQIAAHAVDQAASTGGYRLFPGMPRSMFSPALFFGQAGIGYTLLRLMDPQLPSLLLFD